MARTGASRPRQRLCTVDRPAPNRALFAAPHPGVERTTMSETATMTPSLWTRMSNPGHFMRWSGKAVPWLARDLRRGAGLRPVPDLRRRARRLPAGRNGADHVHPRPRGVARGVLLRRDEPVGDRHPGLAPPARGCRAAGRAPIGAAFTLVCLVTGSLWGKPMWGTYWVWDARLTSMLVLFLIYCGLIALWRPSRIRTAPPAPLPSSPSWVP